MKLKKLVPAALSLALVLSLAACGGGTTNSPAPESDSPAASTDSPAASTETAAPEDDGSLQRVLDAGELAVGAEGNWIPYVYNEDGTGELTGFEVEVATEVASRLGVEAGVPDRRQLGPRAGRPGRGPLRRRHLRREPQPRAPGEVRLLHRLR